MMADEESPSVIGPLAPMPTEEEFKAAYRQAYVALFVEVGVPEEVAGGWFDDQDFADIRDMTPAEAVAAEMEYWDEE